MVDFSLLGQTPNYLDIYKRSYGTGREQAKEDRVANALSSAGTDLVGAEKELMTLGAFDDAAQLRRIRVDQARAKAAKAAQILDYSGAAEASAEAGDIDAVQTFQGQGRAVDLGKQVAAGDTAGAQTAALEAGDLDMAGQIGKLSDAERSRVQQRNNTLGSIAYTLTEVPYEQRRAAIQNVLPQLKAQGFSDEELTSIASADPTDENLKLVIGQAMTLKEAIDAVSPKPVNVPDGADAINPRTGKVIYSNPKNFAPRAPGGGGAPAAPGAASTPALDAIAAELARRKAGRGG